VRVDAGRTGSETSGSPQPSDRVEIVRYEPETVVIHTELASPGWVLLTDTDYPGWAAEIDGTPAPIIPADIQFRAVAVPAGSHTLTFRFQPRSVRWGVWLSALGLLAMAALFMGKRQEN